MTTFKRSVTQAEIDKHETKLDGIAGMSNKEINQFIQTNVTNLATAKVELARLARIVALLLRERRE